MPIFRRNKNKNPCSSALLKWEIAGEKLATALSAYLQSCIAIGTFCDIPSQDARNVATRVDTCFDNLHPKLFEELSRSRVVLARMRNQVSARSYLLPREILAEIFKDVIYISGPKEKPFPSMPEGLKRVFGRLLNLLAVCSTWRNAAMELSELWSIIPASNSRSDHPALKVASLALQRSRALTCSHRQLHLAAIVSNRRYSHRSIPPLINNKIPQFTSINIETRFQLPVYDISRFLTKVFRSQSPSVLSELSLHHCEGSPNKTQFRLPKDHEYIGSRMTTQECNLISKLIGSLSAFRLRNINIRWNTITFSDKLVEIHLQSVVLGNHSKLVEFLRVLKSAPELRDLRLISVIAFVGGFTHPDSNSGDAKISLPKLQSLLLDDLPYNVLETVLTSIAPGSHKITVHPTFKSDFHQPPSDAESDWDYEGEPLLDLLNCSNIDTLIRFPSDNCYGDNWSPWVDREELCEQLESLPNLKTLIMHGWKWDIGDILVLDRNLHSEIPKLTGLYILDGRITDAGSLVQAISTHSLQTLVLDSHPSCLSGCDRDSLIQSFKTIVPDFRLVRGLQGMDEFNYGSWRLW